ncbi:hypothetical protein ACQP10_38195 (plasmid) [Streptosporangium sandarakinum]
MLAADFRRKKPRTVKRPSWLSGPEGKTGMDRAFGIMMATSKTIT